MTATVIQHWDVYECQLPDHPERTMHIVGRVGWKQEFVVTPAITAITSETREAETETGDTYVFGGQVQGGPGVDTKWAWWRDKQGTTDAVRITMQIRDTLLSKHKRGPNLEILRRVTKPISEEAMQAYCEKRWPHLYKNSLLSKNGTEK